MTSIARNGENNFLTRPDIRHASMHATSPLARTAVHRGRQRGAILRQLLIPLDKNATEAHVEWWVIQLFRNPGYSAPASARIVYFITYA
jgi:hypothetical protein